MSNKHTLRDYFTAIGSGDDYQAYYADDIDWQLPRSHPYGAEHANLLNLSGFPAGCKAVVQAPLYAIDIFLPG